MRRNRHTRRLALVLLLLAAIPAVVWISHSQVDGTQEARNGQSDQRCADSAAPATSPPQREPKGTRERDTLPPDSSALNSRASLEEVVEFLKSSASTMSADQMFAELGIMNLSEALWWRNSTEFTELLGLALDQTLPEDCRVVALRLFLAGAPREVLQNSADEIQERFADSSDRLVSALLQDMADRNVAPKNLIRSTLTNPSRGEHAQCMAWYAARLTDKADLELASVALNQAEAGASIISKVAFDYLAAGSVSEQIDSTPSLRRRVEQQLEMVVSLPASAEIIEMATADAFIRAIPSLMDSERSKQLLLETLHNARNPEIRLSALEQIAKRQTSEANDMTAEVDAILKNLINFFPEETKKIRAEAILNRTLLSPKANTK